MAMHYTSDYSTIRRLIEEAGGAPAIIRGTVEDEEERPDILQIAFRGSPKGELEPVSWDEFFDRVEKGNLALIYDNEPEKGTPEFRFIALSQAIEEYGAEEKEGRTLPDSGETEALRNNIVPDDEAEPRRQ